VAFHHIAVSCADPLATEHYYARHFGFERARVLPVGDAQIVFLRAGSVYLELFQADGAAPTDASVGSDGPHYPGWRHIAFKVDNVDAKLAQMGDDAKITLGPLDFDDFIPGWRTVWVADPDGNIVEISQGFVDEADPPRLT
jgi:glyoxylase I family protein